MAEAIKPGHIVTVADLSPDTLRDVIAHLEVSTSFEHFIFREAELGAIWSLIDFALSGETDAAQREDLVQLRCATVQAYESLGKKRPVEASRHLDRLIGWT